MSEGDAETHYAYYCLHRLKKFPHEFFELDLREKAAVMAFIDIQVEDEKKEAAKIKRKK